MVKSAIAFSSPLSRSIVLLLFKNSVKTLLQDLPRKGLFTCIPARSCKMLLDLVESCGILQESCRNLAIN